MARLRDMYREDEIPTSPGTPVALSAARKCKHCTMVYGQHADIFPVDPDAECFGVKANFEPEDYSHGDAER